MSSMSTLNKLKILIEKLNLLTAWPGVWKAICAILQRQDSMKALSTSWATSSGASSSCIKHRNDRHPIHGYANLHWCTFLCFSHSISIGATLYVTVVTCHHHFFTCNLKFFTHCFFLWKIYVQILTLFCQNISASKGFAPWPPTRGSATGSRWGLCPQTRFRLALHALAICPLPVTTTFWCKVVPVSISVSIHLAGTMLTYATVSWEWNVSDWLTTVCLSYAEIYFLTTVQEVSSEAGKCHECLPNASMVRVPVMTLLGYFWDRWPSLAGKLSWDVTTTTDNSALHPSRVAKSSTSFGWGKGGKVTSAGWQVTLCDPVWHVISRSDVVISITNCYIRVYFTLQTQECEKGESSCLFKPSGQSYSS